MSEHVSKAIRRLAAVYGEPKTDYKPELFAEFISALENYRSDVVAYGVDRVIRDRAYPTWPTVGEVVKACRDVADEMSDKCHPAGSAPNGRTYDPVDQATAKELLTKAMAGMDTRNNFVSIRARAGAWVKHHNCRVTTDVDAPWGQEVVDEFGRVVPIGWKPGEAA